MAKDIEKVINLLTDMQRTNVSNANNFDRLLLGISSKLDLGTANKETELLTGFLNELAKTFDEQYSDTLNKIRDIEKAIKAVYDIQDSHVKNSDMKELFEVLSKNINNFYNEARQEKAILAGIEAKIKDFTANKTDKEDILRTISLLRNDLSNINLAYKNTIDDINSTLKSILTGIKNVDPMKTGEVMKAQIDILFKSVNDIISKLNEIEQKGEHIEAVIGNVITNDDFKYSMGIIDSIVTKTKEIEEKLNYNAQKNDIDDLHLAISNIDNKTNLSVTKDDMSLIQAQTDNMLKQTEDIKLILSNVAQNIESIPDSTELEANLKQLYSNIYDISDSIQASNVKSDVSELNEKFNIFKEELALIKSIIGDFNDTISIKVLNSIESLSLDTDNLRKCIIEVSKKYPSKEEIEEILENNLKLNTLLKKSENIEENIASIYSKTLSMENSLGEFTKNNSNLDWDYINTELNNIKLMIEANAGKISNVENLSSAAVTEYLNQVKILLQDNYQGPLYSKITDIESSLVNNQTFNESAFSQILDRINSFESLKNITDQNKQIESAISELSSLKSPISDLIDLFAQKNTKNSDNNTTEIASSLKIENFLADKLSELKEDLVQITNEATARISNEFGYKAELLEQKTAAVQELLSESELTNDLDNPEFAHKIIKTNESLESFKQELQLISTDITENISAKASDVLRELEPIKEILNKVSENICPDTLKNSVKNLNEELTSSPELMDLSSDFEELYDKLNSQISDNENNLKDFILTETDSLLIKFESLKEYVELAIKAIIPPNPEQMKELISFVSDLDSFRKEQVALLKDSSEDIKNVIKTQSEEIKSLLAIASNHEDIIEAIEVLKKNFKLKTAKKKSKTSEAEDSVETGENYYSDSAIEELRDIFDEYSQKIDQLSDKNSQIADVLKIIGDKLDSLTVKTVTNVADNLNDDELTDDFDITENDIFGDDKFDFVQAFDMLQNDIQTLSHKVEETLNQFDEKISGKDNVEAIDDLNQKLAPVLDTYSNNWLSDLKAYIKTNNNYINMQLDTINSKLDIFVSDTTSVDLMNEISETINDINDNIESIYPKIDVIEPQIQVITPMVERVDRKIDGLQYQLDELSPKIEEIVPTVEDLIGSDIDGLSYKLDELSPKIEEKLSESDQKISSMLEELKGKMTELSSKNSSIEEFNDIKTLIGEQKQYLKELEPSEKLDAFKKCLDEMSSELNMLATDSNADSEKLHNTIKDMKESLMSTVVDMFGQVSFVEESEDIKDFVEERTSEINQRISEITKQLQGLNVKNDSDDYTYTMQDIETDLTKLRLALQQSSNLNLTDVTEKLHKITSSVDSLTQDEMKELKTEISNLKNQTEFLAATSDKYYNAINVGMEGFEEILHSNISDKIDSLIKKLDRSVESDKVIKQALIYMGEWIDSASESINKISANSDEIIRINDVIEGLDQIKSFMTEKSSDMIDEKFSHWNTQFKALEKQFTKVDKMETQLAKQQERIDRLEMSIDKLINIVENLDDPAVSKKIDKIEKQMAKLSNNVEKLASYVD